MTKKDYNIIAKVLRQAIIEIDADVVKPQDPTFTINIIAHNLGIAFMVGNPRFSMDKFLEDIRKK